MKTIFAVVLLASVASGATQMLDAAEFDIGANALTYEGSPMVAWRITIDNTKGLTDLTDVWFKMNYTGSPNAMPKMSFHIPASPWYGASNVRTEFLIDGVVWGAATVYSPQTQEWGPGFIPEGALPDPSHWGIVPAGCSWDAVMAISGPDVKLFHSPASGDVTIDGVVTTLYDDDPLPQTVPEPSVLFLMSASAYGLLSRRRRAGRARFEHGDS